MKNDEKLTQAMNDQGSTLNSHGFGDKIEKPPVGLSISQESPSSLKIRTTPILMDNITLTNRVVAGEFGDRPNQGFGFFEGPLEHAHYFANPYVYPTNKSRPLYNMYGRHNARTNGVRVLRAYIGTPLPHRGGHEKSINLYEDTNQLSDHEVSKTVEIASANGQAPGTWQLFKTFEALGNGRTELIGSCGLEALNPPSVVAKQVRINRLETYFEVLNPLDVEELVSVMETVLKRYLKSARQKRNNIQKNCDAEEYGSYMSWEVPQKLFHPSFSGKNSFRFKIYKKGDRIRIEVQANSPKLKVPTDRSVHTDPLICLALDAKKIMECVTEVLEAIWSMTITELTAYSPKHHIQDQIMARMKILLPIKSRHPNASLIAGHIATEECISLEDLKRYGWTQNDLSKLAHKQFGFLKVRKRGFVAEEQTINGRPKRVVGGIYDLVKEDLKRAGKMSTIRQDCVRQRDSIFGFYQKRTTDKNLELVKSAIGAASWNVFGTLTDSSESVLNQPLQLVP